MKEQDNELQNCPDCGGEIDYPFIGEHQEQGPYLACKKCPWNELPEVVYVAHAWRSESLIVSKERWNFVNIPEGMYRKNGVDPEEHQSVLNKLHYAVESNANRCCCDFDEDGEDLVKECAYHRSVRQSLVDRALVQELIGAMKNLPIETLHGMGVRDGLAKLDAIIETINESIGGT